MNTQLQKFVGSSKPLRHRSTGFTLIEMMIAIALGLVIIAGLMTVMANGSTNSRTNERVSETQINARFALSSIRQELLHAGNIAYSGGHTPAPVTALGTLPKECLQAGAPVGSFVSNMQQAVWGSNNANPFSGNANCIPSASYATNDDGSGEDVLVIRRLNDIAATNPTLATGTVYFASGYAQGKFFRSQATPTLALSALKPEYFAVRAYAYYVSPFTVQADENPRIPALYRSALRPDGSMESELVASGVERFQVQYALYDDKAKPPTTRYSDTLTGSSFDTEPTEWSDVTAVRIWLLARDATPEPGYTNTGTYVLGDKSYTVNDSFRRQMFSTVVQLRNKYIP